MAFPTNPVDGQLYNEAGKTWLYVSPPGVWTIAGGTPISVDESDPVFTASAAAGYTEAPADGQQYARKDLGWEVVAAGAGDLAGLTDTTITTPLNGEVLQYNGAAWVNATAPAGYTDGDVDTHLNQSTALTGEVLSWNGADYDWITPPAGYSDADVDTHLNVSGATTGQVLSWDGADYAWVASGGGGTITNPLDLQVPASLGTPSYSGSTVSTTTYENAASRAGKLIVFDVTINTPINGGDTGVWWGLGTSAGFRIMHYGGFNDWTVEHQGVRTRTGVLRQAAGGLDPVRIGIHVAADNTITYFVAGEQVQQSTATNSLTQDIRVEHFNSGANETSDIYIVDAATAAEALGILSGALTISQIEATGNVTDSVLTFKQYEGGVLTSYTLADLAGGGAAAGNPLDFNIGGTGQIISGAQELFEFDGNLTNSGATGADALSIASGSATYNTDRNGNPSSALFLNSSNYLSPITAPTAGPNDPNWFVGVWFKSDGSAFPLNACVFGTGYTSNLLFCMATVNDSQTPSLALVDYRASWTRVVASTQPTWTEWNHYAMQRNGDNLYLFLNGQLVATQTGANAQTYPDAWNLGRYTGTLAGDYDKLEMHNTSVVTDVNAGFVVQPATKVAEIEATGNTADSVLTFKQYESGVLTSYTLADLAYGNADVDTHLNTGTATAGEVLSWNGSDYDWVAQGGGGTSGIAFNLISTEPTAAGSLSLSVGNAAIAPGQRTVSIGSSATPDATGRQVVVGSDASATGEGSVTIGQGSAAKGSGSITMGVFAGTGNTGANTILIGDTAGAGASTNGGAIHISSTGLSTTVSEANEMLIQTPKAKIEYTAANGFVFTEDVGGTNTTYDLSSLGGGGVSGLAIAAVTTEPSATGATAIAIGNAASANLTDSVSIGKSAVCNGSWSVAVGPNSIVGSSHCIAVGNTASASGSTSIAMGRNSSCSAVEGMAIGFTSNATGQNAVAIGGNSSAQAYSVAIGGRADASDTAAGQAVAVGYNSRAEDYSTAVGYRAGYNVTANGNTFIGWRAGDNTNGGLGSATGCLIVSSNTAATDTRTTESGELRLRTTNFDIHATTANGYLFKEGASEARVDPAAGVYIFPNLPTADPVVAGQLWNDAGTLKVSAG